MVFLYGREDLGEFWNFFKNPSKLKKIPKNGGGGVV